MEMKMLELNVFDHTLSSKLEYCELQKPEFQILYMLATNEFVTTKSMARETGKKCQAISVYMCRVNDKLQDLGKPRIKSLEGRRSGIYRYKGDIKVVCPKAFVSISAGDFK
jgi:hypothetical protein